MIDFLMLFVYSIAAFGLAYVVGHSVISVPLRTWIVGTEASRLRYYAVTLLECPTCFGWWTGVAFGVGLVAWYGWPLVTILFAAFYTCGSNFLIGRASGLVRHPEE